MGTTELHHYFLRMILCRCCYESDLQQALWQFAAMCEVAGVNSNAIVLYQKRKDCSLWVGGKLCPQAVFNRYEVWGIQ